MDWFLGLVLLFLIIAVASLIPLALWSLAHFALKSGATTNEVKSHLKKMNNSIWKSFLNEGFLWNQWCYYSTRYHIADFLSIIPSLSHRVVHVSRGMSLVFPLFVFFVFLSSLLENVLSMERKVGIAMFLVVLGISVLVAFRFGIAITKEIDRT